MRLSPRDVDLIRLSALYKSNKEIASALRLSESTVKTYKNTLSGKLGFFGGNVPYAAIALKYKILTPEEIMGVLNDPQSQQCNDKKLKEWERRTAPTMESIRDSEQLTGKDFSVRINI